MKTARLENAVHEFNQVQYVEHEECCPVHQTPVRKVYTFGMQDAEVTTFNGCGCALTADCERAWFIQAELAEHGIPSCGASYHKSYAEASGKATLIKMHNASR